MPTKNVKCFSNNMDYSCRREMKDKLEQKNISGDWRDLKTISGYKEPHSQPVGDQKSVNIVTFHFIQSYATPDLCSVLPAATFIVCSPCVLALPHLLPPSQNIQLTATICIHCISCPMPCESYCDHQLTTVCEDTGM